MTGKKSWDVKSGGTIIKSGKSDKRPFFDADIRAIFEKAIDKWGEQFQLNMVAEECCELAKASLKVNRKLNGYTMEQVIDEMVDVYIMLGQLEVILDRWNTFNVNRLIVTRFDEKMKRLEAMLNVK